MDEDTQKLIERARQRREMLNQRAANMPEAAPRKRRTPVLDSDGSERDILSEQQNKQDDSPKRQCLREDELNLKPDTPAIRSVQSRSRDLIRSTNGADQENMTDDAPVPSPRKSVSSPPLRRKAYQASPTKSPERTVNMINTPSSARKSRFAALAQNISSWEDDLSHPVPQKDDENGHNLRSASPKKTVTPQKVIAVPSPKKSAAPPVPCSPSKSVSKPAVSSPSFARNSPLRGSKVELNRSPKPFSSNYETSASKSKSENSLVSGKAQFVGKSSSATAVPESATGNFSVSKTNSPMKRNAKTPEPSTRPMSAKLASFEQKITENTPSAAFSRSTKTPKQVQNLSASTPVPSKSTPAVSRATGFSASTPAAGRKTPAVARKTPAANKAADCDPSELPISQRMSKMQDKLKNVASPGTQRKDSEPTAFSVNARMSAWENMTSSNLVSDIKKVDPAVASPCKPSGFTPKKIVNNTAPKNPPAPPAVTKAVTPAKSFKESIQNRASEVLKKKDMGSSGGSPGKASPQKTTNKESAVKKGISRSPTKIHSPTKKSTGTKVVQQRLAECTKESNTCGSSLAAQSRAARQAELDAIQNRWKNGVLREESSSSASEDIPSDLKVPNDLKVNIEKREASRNRAREDFNSKLADIGLDMGSKSSTSVQPPKPANGQTSAPKNLTGSIYSLIKKRDDAKQDQEKANDSFNDSDDESEKIPRSVALRAAAKQKSEDDVEFRRPADPVEQTLEDSETEDTAASCSDEFGSSEKLPMDIDDDDISLKGFVSESVRRESILPPSGTLQRGTSHSSLDSYDECYKIGGAGTSAGGPGGYQADQSDEEDSSMEESSMAVNDLLDEAMEDSESDQEVTLRKKPPVYDPDMDPDNVVLRRRPQTAPQLERSFSDDEEEDSNPYSLQAYRKSANLHMQNLEPIVRASKYVGRNVKEENIEMPTAAPRTLKDDRRLVQERIKELQELVSQEQSVIMQTSNALNKCCLGNSYFAGSAEQVECNRVLLIACQKRQVYMTEIQRLKNSGVLHPDGGGPQGTLTISDIRLPLKKDFVTKIGTHQDLTTHYFILLIRNDCQVICTQMLSTHDPMMRGSLDFPNLIKINGITGNFNITIDIYSMSISREPTKDKKRKTPKKTPKKGYAMHLESPGGPSAVRTTSFCHVTSVPLTMKSLDKNSFHLDRLPCMSPLYGQIFMRLKCLMESNVEERGFLTMFDDVSGFGAWHRRWCVLAGNKLCVWKYPDDESRKDPMFLIDLKRCITEKVGLVSREYCARPNTFALETVRQPLRGERDTLITRTHNTVTSVRHQMSADSKEERIVWCNKLNRALANLRTWNADAMKPMKASSSSSRC